MSCEDLKQKRPKHIDVYTDGSFIYKGQKNPEAAAGWGAAVIEIYGDGQKLLWTPSGPCSKRVTGANDAEIEAGIKALEAIKIRESYRPSDDPMPSITLHSDQINWSKRINAYRESSNRTPTSHMEELAELAIQMNTETRYTSHDKTAKDHPRLNSRIMDYPHTLSRREAWQQRIEKQGGKAHFSEPIELKGHEDIHEVMAKLFPLKSEFKSR